MRKLRIEMDSPGFTTHTAIFVDDILIGNIQYIEFIANVDSLTPQINITIITTKYPSKTKRRATYYSKLLKEFQNIKINYNYVA